MPSITTNSVVMREKANALKGISTSINSISTDLKNEINRLRGTWEGEAVETLVNRFNTLTQSFQERYQVINSYADFLLKAADAYEQVENQAKQQLG